MAPLPLPATPLRRSEKKRPPSPPGLIGKMAMGPIKWITRDGKRVQHRDWMTDPADISTLLEWTNDKLGINYRSIEADFGHFSFDPRELPALLFAVHPALSESVAWISERKDVLSGLFWFLALWFYVGYVQRSCWRRFRNPRA